MLACCLVVNSVDLVVSFTGMVWVLCFMMGMVVVGVVGFGLGVGGDYWFIVLREWCTL